MYDIYPTRLENELATLGAAVGCRQLTFPESIEASELFEEIAAVAWIAAELLELGETK